MSDSVTPTLVTLWWLSFFTALGLCIGSFLNAVIYRLPRNRSLRNPLWSSCPGCRARISWYDNLPVLSFVLLGGRCRHCGVPISTRYPVIELSMALIVLMLVDAFFVGRVRGGLGHSPVGLTDRLVQDWPMLLAQITLFACLLPMAAIDLEHYWVDIRFTNLATVTGFLCHIIWTPAHSAAWIRPHDATAAAALLAMVGLGITQLVLLCQPHVAADELGEPPPDHAPDAPGAPAPRRPPPSLASGSRGIGWVAAALLLGTFVSLALHETDVVNLRHTGRAMLPLIMFFALIVWESTVRRSADQHIAEVIDEERHTARRMVLKELGLLLPAMAAAAVGLWVMASYGDIADRVHRALHAAIEVPGVAMMRDWRPLWGLATAATGYLIAGGVGWLVRIVFTLAFGREAFGTGDIHLMAAAGCVAGWPVVVLGFFLTCLLAMVGWLVALPFKRSRALPLGPWLALSFLTVVVYYDSLIRLPVIDRAVQAVHLLLS